MTDNIKHLIEQYTLGNLSHEEVKDFNLYLEKNPDIKKEVEIQQNILEAIKQKGRVELKANLAKIDPLTPSNTLQKIAVVAATIATATIVGVGIYSTTLINKTQVAKEEKLSSKTRKDAVVLESINKPSKITQVTTNEEQLAVENLGPKQEQKVFERSSSTKSKQQADIKQQTTINDKKTDTELIIETKEVFDPAKLSLENNGEEDKLGQNGESLETDPSIAQSSVSTIPNHKISDSKIQGYTYDGSSIGISGTYKSTYVVTKKLGMLIFEYDGNYYKIIESEKIEPWKDHQISDPNLLEKLK